MTKKNLQDKIDGIPTLYDAGGNLAHKWHVSHYIDGVRVKVYKLSSDALGGLNRLKTANERYAYAQRIIAELCSNDSIVMPTTEKQLARHSPKRVIPILRSCLEERKPYLRKKTYQTAESKLNGLEAYFDKRGGNMDTDGIRLFLDSLKVHNRSNTTINSYRRTINTLFVYALKTKQLDIDNPFVVQGILKEQRQGCKAFSTKQQVELKRVIGEENPVLWVCCQLQYYCFIRPGEMRLLKIGDIDLDEGKILVRGTVSKNKKSEYVTIPTVFLQVLKGLGIDQMNTGYYFIGKGLVIGGKEPMGVDRISRIHARILRRLGYDLGYGGYGFYSWKHRGVTNAVKNGINLGELQRQLRHHSLDEMQHYLRDLGLTDLPQVRDMFPEI